MISSFNIVTLFVDGIDSTWYNVMVFDLSNSFKILINFYRVSLITGVSLLAAYGMNEKL